MIRFDAPYVAVNESRTNILYRNQGVDLAWRDHEPYDTLFPPIPWPEGIPTDANPVWIRREAADVIIVRTRSASMGTAGVGTYYDEYWLRDPSGYSGVAGGWYIWKHFAHVGKRITWLDGPADQGQMPNIDFALRIGRTTNTYHSGGEGPAAYYRGFGHGGMVNVPANNQLILSGGLHGSGANLQSVANWPVGTEKFGASFNASCAYTLFLTEASVNNNVTSNFNYTLLFDTLGVRQIGSGLRATVADLGWQDTYTLLTSVSRNHADTFKQHSRTAVSLVEDGVQKANVDAPNNPYELQFYKASEPTIIRSHQANVGMTLRRAPSALTAWQFCRFRRSFLRDLPDFPKAYAFALSSEEVAPRNWEPMEQTPTSYDWQNRLTTWHRVGGPN